MSAELVLHVGYPKAASSWLQQTILTRGHGFRAPWPTHENRIIEEVVWPNEAGFDAEALARAFASDAAADGEAADAAPVISHEALAGDPIRGVYFGERTARRLAAAFGGARGAPRVIIAVRRQSDYAYAAWSEHIARGGSLSLDAYIATDGVAAGNRSFCPPEFLRFNDLVERYIDLFDEENVFVLPIEALLQTPDDAMTGLAAFLGRPEIAQASREKVYAGAGALTRRARASLNRHFGGYDPSGRTATPKFIQHTTWRLDRRLPKRWQERRKQAEREALKARLRGAFAASNAALQRRVAFDLDRLGYDL